MFQPTGAGTSPAPRWPSQGGRQAETRPRLVFPEAVLPRTSAATSPSWISRLGVRGRGVSIASRPPGMEGGRIVPSWRGPLRLSRGTCSSRSRPKRSRCRSGAAEDSKWAAAVRNRTNGPSQGQGSDLRAAHRLGPRLCDPSQQCAACGGHDEQSEQLCVAMRTMPVRSAVRVGQGKIASRSSALGPWSSTPTPLHVSQPSPEGATSPRQRTDW